MEQNEPSPDASLIDRSIAGMVWVTLDKLGGSGVNFVITVLLARLLFPADFGLVAMAMVFFEFSAVFVESGFSTALIREKSISATDKSTTFLFNMVSAVVLYAVLYLCAPFIAAFYGAPLLTVIVRVMGLNLIVDALSIVQSSALVQRVDFRTQALARFGAVAISGTIGVWMAYAGHGVWALVARILVNGGVLALLLWKLDPWKPSLEFNKASFRRLFGFGSRILAAGLLDKFFSQAYKLVIGKFFSATALGFYMQAGTFVNMAINTLFRPVQTVSYPVLAKLQGDRSRLKSGYRTILQLSSFVMFPALALLGVLAAPVIGVLIGEKWLQAAPYLRLLCIAGATVHISSVNLNVLLVLGRSDLSLRLEIIKKVNIAIAIAIGLQFGVMGLVAGEVIVSCVNLLINAFYSKKLLGYTPLEQMRDMAPTFLLSCVGGTVAFVVQSVLPFEGASGLLVSATTGGLVYLSLHMAGRTQEWRLVTDTVVPKAWGMISGQARP
jgi:teichuronic acid exporter